MLSSVELVRIPPTSHGKADTWKKLSSNLTTTAVWSNHRSCLLRRKCSITYLKCFPCEWVMEMPLGGHRTQRPPSDGHIGRDFNTAIQLTNMEQVVAWEQACFQRISFNLSPHG